MESLDPRLFHQILHAFLRDSSQQAEIDRAADCLRWLDGNLGPVFRVFEKPQKNLMGALYDYWAQYQSAPTRDALETAVRKIDKPDSMLDILMEYNALKPHLVKGDALDMPRFLVARRTDWDQAMVHEALEHALHINDGRIAGARPTDKSLSGSKDALAYIMQKMQQGLLSGHHQAVGGSIKDSGDLVIDSYQKTLSESAQGKLVIPTYLTEVDAVLGGLRRKGFTGVLGYAGQRKSALCRSIIYRAAEMGFRGLHIPLESDAREEFNIYGIMHSFHKKFENSGIKLNFGRFDTGKLTDEEWAFLTQEVLPDLKYTFKGDIIVRQPAERTWAAVKTLIETESRMGAIDFVFIDYLTLLDVEGKNQMDAMNAVIRDAKHHCLNLGDKQEGYCLLTPIQGNRAGWDKAAANGGAWSKDGCGQYNELEKSADIIMYVFSDPELQANDQLKVGTCKSRRSADVPVTTVGVSPDSGLVENLSATTLRQMRRRDVFDSDTRDCLDDAHINYDFDNEEVSPWTN
jgi:hypothetical protein